MGLIELRLTRREPVNRVDGAAADAPVEGVHQKSWGWGAKRLAPTEGNSGAAFRARLSAGAESMVKAVARNRYEGRVFGVGLNGEPGGDALTFKVRGFINAGAFGVVHRVDVESASAEALAAHPQLWDGDTPRKDLVVKFPHQVPWPFPQSTNPWKRAVLSEVEQTSTIQKALGSDRIDGTAILFAGHGPEPFVIKPFMHGQDIKALKSKQADLTTLQVERLESDIFAPAQRLAEKHGVYLDIKPENLAWQEERQRWGMYELTTLPRQIRGFFLAGGFPGYLANVRARMRQVAN